MAHSIMRVGTWTRLTLASLTWTSVALATAPLPPLGAKAATEGQFTVLTYNVAGLPEFISQSDPVRNIPVISGLLNLYDLALVQEDFAYHQALASRARHPYQSAPLLPNGETGMGDGLSVFSRLPFARLERVAWRSCHGTLSDGSDCLTSKGFTVSTHSLAPGIELDVYNLHMDSGSSRADGLARADQLAQLLEHLAARSRGRAVVVAGDTNTDEDAEAFLEGLRVTEGLTDTCRALGCKDPQRIDRVLFRGSPSLELRPLQFTVDPRFVKRGGGDLSDHKAVGVRLAWRSRGETAAPGFVKVASSSTQY